MLKVGSPLGLVTQRQDPLTGLGKECILYNEAGWG